MSVIQKLEAFKWKNLPNTGPVSNDDNEDHRPVSFDDLAARVRITSNDVVSAQAELARAQQAHEDAISDWKAASAELIREPIS